MKFGSILKILLFLLACGPAWAQRMEGETLIGLDVSKNVPILPFLKNYKYFFQRGFLAELPLYYPLKVRGLALKATPGYAAIAADPIYRNLKYRNEGFLLKVGVEYFPIRYFSVGGGFNTAIYEESGQYVLPGPFYGELYLPFAKRRLFAAGLEGHYAGYLYFGRHFFISPEVRFVIHTVPTHQSPDSYYIPGMGATDRDLPVTGGVSVRLGYALHR